MDDTIVKEFREAFAGIKTGLDGYGTAFSGIEAKMTGFDGKMDGLKGEMDAIAARVTEIELAAKRPGASGSVDEKSEYCKAFNGWARKGERFPEVKLLTVADDTTGGFLAPKEFSREVLRIIEEYNPIRSLCRVRPTSRRAMMIPKRTGHIQAYWVADGADKQDAGNFNFGMEEIPVHEMGAYCDIGMTNLEDTEFDLEGELMKEFGYSMGLLEAEAFLSGNKVGKPEGVLNNGSIDAVDGVDTTSHKLDADDFINLYYHLKGFYAKRGVWFMNRDTIAAARKLKLSDTGDYIWAPGLQNLPDTILGRPVVECPDMADIGTDDNVPIVFGDFNSAYTILDRTDISILRDQYTLAKSAAIRFYARKRVGGQVVMPEALVKLKV